MNDHITVDPRICNGKPVIAGTRIPVTVILDQLAEAGSVQEVVNAVSRTLSRAGHSRPAILPRHDRSLRTRTGGRVRNIPEKVLDTICPFHLPSAGILTAILGLKLLKGVLQQRQWWLWLRCLGLYRDTCNQRSRWSATQER